jgi:hypothetical protein
MENFYIIIITIILVLLLGFINNNIYFVNKDDIKKLTDKWCDEVTVNHNPENIAKLFCKDATLLGTVSQIKRRGDNIKYYFNYFAKLPNIKIVSKEYNISKISSKVYVNSAFITWHWDGLKNPIIARMTFIYRNRCIFQLHSSGLPELNYELLSITNKK